MKKIGVLLLLALAGVAAAQQSGQNTIASATVPDKNSGDQPATVQTSANFPTVQMAKPTYADLYCAGMISKQLLPNANYVAGGLQTPNTTKYVTGDVVYLAGSGYQPGAQYSIVR